MLSIQWDNSLTVGVQQFDKHHERLFELLNKIYAVSSASDQKNNLKTIIDELLDYSTYHFAAEEYLLNKHGYNDLSSQVMEHEYFILRVLEFKRDLINDDNVPQISLIWFLGNWLLHHIMEVDKKYSTHLNNLNIS